MAPRWRITCNAGVAGDTVSSLGQEGPLEGGMAAQPTPIFLPGESHEQRNLVSLQSRGSQRVGHNWSGLAHRQAFLWWFLQTKEELSQKAPNNLLSLSGQWGISHSQDEWVYRDCLRWISSCNRMAIIPCRTVRQKDHNVLHPGPKPTIELEA